MFGKGPQLCLKNDVGEICHVSALYFEVMFEDPLRKICVVFRSAQDGPVLLQAE